MFRFSCSLKNMFFRLHDFEKVHDAIAMLISHDLPMNLFLDHRGTTRGESSAPIPGLTGKFKKNSPIFNGKNLGFF